MTLAVNEMLEDGFIVVRGFHNSSFCYTSLIFCLGMAMRLAFDLALHVDMSSYVARGAISVEEESLRRTVFWGAYTVEL
jgi:hypothetical protein